jgi:hypothetical protein
MVLLQFRRKLQAFPSFSEIFQDGEAVTLFNDLKPRVKADWNISGATNLTLTSSMSQICNLFFNVKARLRLTEIIVYPE